MTAEVLEPVVAAESADPPVSAAYARYAIGVLLVLSVLNFLDRQVLSILAEPIKRDLGLADWQIGAMSGLAFAVFYTVLGIPIARLAERGDRPYIIAACAAIWSAFTALCGFAGTFTHLALARMGVGVGEAGCSPTAHSLISDYVPKERRARAISVYMSGTPLGALLGMAIGGVIADQWGWRAAFMLVGAPGLLMALLAAFTLPEPRRRKGAAIARPAATVNLGDALRTLWGKRTYRLIVMAVCLNAVVQYGLQSFLASFFFRNHTAELAQVAAMFGLKSAGFLGITLGLALGVAGVAGAVLGGVLADHFGARDGRARVIICGLGVMASPPFYIAALMTGSLIPALFLLVIPAGLTALYFGPAYSVVQGLVEPRTRATSSALMLLMVNLIGLGMGPLAIGVLSDVLSGPAGLGEAAGVKWSLAVFALLSIPAGLLFLASRKSVREETVS